MRYFGLALGALAMTSGAAEARLIGILRDTAKAAIIDSRGLPVGEAKFSYSKKHNALIVKIKAEGLTRGEHGVHLHMVGTCEGPKFATAGAHWNPTNKMHGLSNAEGSHSGDMPNMLVGKKGKGKLQYEIAGGQLNGEGGLLDQDGAAVIIHAQSDDQRTDPSGNSGDRVACGVIIG
jgi:superoxide dismutase, Cu-Zn family